MLLSLLAYSATDSKVVTITVQLHELTIEEEELLHKLCLLDKYKDVVACVQIQETYDDTYDEGKEEKTDE